MENLYIGRIGQKQPLEKRKIIRRGVFSYDTHFEVVQNCIMAVEGTIILLLSKYIKNNDILCENLSESL